jgi:hypothetical protein
MKTFIVRIALTTGLVVNGTLCAQDLADPTRPSAYKVLQQESGPVVEAQPETALKGIWAVGSRRYALLNSETVEVGSKFAGKRVTSITDNAVTLRGDGGNETLMLVAGIEKKDRTAVPEPPQTSSSKRKRSTEK